MDCYCVSCKHRDKQETLICGNCVYEWAEDNQTAGRTYWEERSPRDRNEQSAPCCFLCGSMCEVKNYYVCKQCAEHK